MALGRRAREDSLRSAARKKSAAQDPLVSSGRHFGRTVHAFCNIKSLIIFGLEQMGAEDKVSAEEYTAKERQEIAVFKGLLAMCRRLQGRLLDSDGTEEIDMVADFIQKGCKSSRADDTKTMKPAIIDWITIDKPAPNPRLDHRVKFNRGFKHELTGALLCPAGKNWSDPETKQKLTSGEMIVPGHSWPIFLYVDLVFDPQDPWKGLLRNALLITAFKHIFISPSLAANPEDKRVVVKGGNARIHGMKHVTLAALVYVATQVRFALLDAETWSRTDRVLDSELFYNTLLDELQHPRGAAHMKDLLSWWDSKVFPHSAPDVEVVPLAGTPLDRIRQLRMEEEVAASGDGEAA